jgi:hypothetical protein
MPKQIMMVELHIQVTVPRNHPAEHLRALRRYLGSPLFRRQPL